MWCFSRHTQDKHAFLRSDKTACARSVIALITPRQALPLMCYLYLCRHAYRLRRQAMRMTWFSHLESLENEHHVMMRFVVRCVCVSHVLRVACFSFISEAVMRALLILHSTNYLSQIGSCGKCGNQTDAMEAALDDEHKQYRDLLRINHAVSEVSRQKRAWLEADTRSTCYAHLQTCEQHTPRSRTTALPPRHVPSS